MAVRSDADIGSSAEASMPQRLSLERGFLFCLVRVGFARACSVFSPLPRRRRRRDTLRQHTAFRMVTAALALLILAGCEAAATPAQTQGETCRAGPLSLLTVNILYDETDTREARLNRLADAIAARHVDVVFLQEATGGLLAGTVSTAADLQDRLAERGLSYGLRTARFAGVPGARTVFNATLSRCRITESRAVALTRSGTPAVLDEPVDPPGALLLTRINVPGHGAVDTWNAHLCAHCTARDRGRQVKQALGVIAKTSGEHLTVLGGDFNLNRFAPKNRAVERATYRSIVNAGFVDTAAQKASGGPDGMCVSPATMDRWCTFGVTGIKKLAKRRLDYVFVRPARNAATVETLFNPVVPGGRGPTVSDHAALLVTLAQ